MPTQKKIDSVKALEEKIEKASAIVLTDYRGLKHKQLEELRRELKKAGGELTIAKNRLLARALGDQAEGLAEALKEPTAVLFSYDDPISPIKALVDFLKDTDAAGAKGGLLGTKPLTVDEVAALSKLPSREVLLTQLAGQLQAPIRGLHYGLSWNINKLVYALNAVKESKSN